MDSGRSTNVLTDWTQYFRLFGARLRSGAEEPPEQPNHYEYDHIAIDDDNFQPLR
jgi:hypothetical protein